MSNTPAARSGRSGGASGQSQKLIAADIPVSSTPEIPTDNETSDDREVHESPQFQQFSTQLLRGMSARMRQTYSNSQLRHFLKGRYTFFQEAVRRKGMVRVSSFSQLSENTEGKYSNGYVTVDIASPDAPFSVISVESLMRHLDLRVTNKLHPMVGVVCSPEREIQEVVPPIAADVPAEKAETFDCICLEIEAETETEFLKRLEKRIAGHMKAVQLSHRDQQEMLMRLEALQKNVASAAGVSAELRREWSALCGWLAKDNLAVFGYVAFVPKSTDSAENLQILENSGRGILADEYLHKTPGKLLEILAAHLWKRQNSEFPFVLDRVRSISPILRFENLMRLTLRIPDEHYGVVEHIFLGLLKGSSLHTKNTETPLIHRKMRYIFRERQMPPNSYDYNEVVRIFSATPKFELFSSSEGELLQMCDALLSVNNPNLIHCFRIESPRKTHFSEVLKLMVVIPSTLFTEQAIEHILALLQALIPHQYCDWFEARGGEKSRLHIEFELQEDNSRRTLRQDGKNLPHLDLSQLEDQISKRINPWENQLLERLRRQHPGSAGKQLYERYVMMMPSHYRARVDIQEAIEDIQALELLVHEDGIQFNLKPFTLPSLLLGQASLLYVYSKNKIHLIEIMPILQNLGLHVIDQLTTRIGNGQKTLGFVQSFRVTRNDGLEINEGRYKPLLEAVVQQVFQKKTEDDPLNGLALRANLDWREINVLQLYRNLYLQLSTPLTRETINAVLLRHPRCARLLFESFACRFSLEPSFGVLAYRKEVLFPQKKQEFLESLENVAEVTDDTVLRRLFELIENTLRTNFYLPRSSGDTAISIKLDSRSVEQMPVPVPFREIYVHDVGMEGTHLRFGPVARGGLRWSERPDDFRTEILGLVKTQQTKNVVIVPVGSKGGFVVKRSANSRESEPYSKPHEAVTESQNQYRRFISALLDITDNFDAQGEIRSPNHVLAYDEPDPYLVVAADKGTATFSDIANEISEKYDFWLGDAFASGGSVGYDHKKEGITARGGWECVKLHFREMGRDINSEPTTVIGVGDMSGDVFGNGMLQSKALLLQAAFNHLHIFIDPNPDPEKSWKERKRLFELPRSTWKNYSQKLLSSGGGVYERNAKSLELSPEVQAILGTEAKNLNGEEVVRLILQMNADLLWFGGIGTYIKAPAQTNFQVGDQANNAVRIDSGECRAKVIGEGANLGITQPARIELANHGVRLNTDAIDNSAGVNMSDYEVNLKILLQQMLRNGNLPSIEDRNKLFASATDEVSELVLANNRGQHRLISMDGIRSLRNFRLFRRLIAHLQARGMNKRSEYIPSRAELDQLEHTQLPMPRPVLSVLQAYAKMEVYDALTASKMPLEEALTPEYLAYLPPILREHFGEQANQHPLKKEIVSTVLTNKIVNQAGSVSVSRMMQLTDRSIPDIVRTYLVMDAALGATSLRESLLSLKGISEEKRYNVLVDLEDVLKMLTRSVLRDTNRTLPGFKQVPQYRKLLHELLEYSATSAVFSPETPAVKDSENENPEETTTRKTENLDDRRQQSATPMTLESIQDTLSRLRLAPDVLHLCVTKNLEVSTANRLATWIEEQFGFDWLLERLRALEPQNDWELEHHDILMRTLDIHKKSLFELLSASRKGEAYTESSKSLDSENSGDFAELLKPLEDRCATPLRIYRQSLEQLRTGSPVSLTSIAVILSRLDFLKNV